MAVHYIIGRRRRRLPQLHWRSTAWLYLCAIVTAFFLSVLNCVYNPNGLLSVGRDRNRRNEPCWVSSLLQSSELCSWSCDDEFAFPLEMEDPETKQNIIDTKELELTQTKVISLIETIFRRKENSVAGKIRRIDVGTISEILSRKAEEGSVTDEQRKILSLALETYSRMNTTVKSRSRKSKADIRKNEGVKKGNVDNARAMKDAPMLMYKDETGIPQSASFSSRVITFRDSYNLTVVKEGFRTWVPNAKNRDFIRKKLQECCSAHNNMVATQSNIAPGTMFGGTSDLSYTVTKNFYSSFPVTSPFPSALFRTCAVVGNSGILLKSNCGKQIDSADYVFRINLPPTKGKEAHAQDVGSKRNLTTAIYHQVKKFQKYAQKKEEVLEMLESFYGLLLIRKPTGYLLAVDQVLQDSERPLRLVYQNPEHYISVNDYWNKHGLHITITTGLYLISSALTLCEEVTAYGFWPFPFTEFGKKVPFHYWVGHIFLPLKERGTVHDMAAEFMTIRDLHREGVVRVVTDKCKQ